VSLSTTIKSIQDIMRKDVGVDGDAQRIGQLTWLLFLKIWDDREQELELIEPGFRSPLVGVTWHENGGVRRADDLRWRAWAADSEGMTGDTLINFAEQTLFPALKGMDVGPNVDAMGEGTGPASTLRRRRLLVRSVFEDAYQYMKSGTLLRQVINRLQADIDFNDARNRHLFGDIYEQILRDLQSAGNAGEYYTPRAVTQFAVAMSNPRLGEKVLDPACGTGGFLAGSIEHIRRTEVRTTDQEGLLQETIHGVEKKPLPHLLCVTNMIVHGIDVPSLIERGNTLARPLRDISTRDRVDVILTNPPFGGIEEDGIENNFPVDVRTRETADLFLVMIMELLKPGGRAAVVLPDGTLFGEGVKTRIKERLLADCNLHTIVRLPAGVFAPYTTIKTNVLFLEKGTPTVDVWYYEHPYPDGVGSYSKTRPMRVEEFGPETEWWHDRRETAQAWKVSIAQIRERRYNLDIPNPNRPSPEHGESLALQRRVAEASAKEAGLLDDLARMLEHASEGFSLPRDGIRASLQAVVGAPDGIAYLRQIVMRLAVSGALVPQDVTDEPGAILLERIRRTRKKLVKDHLIHDAIALPAPSAGDFAFQLPPRWASARLSEVAAVLDFRREPVNATERQRRIAGKPADQLYPYYGATQQQGWIDDYLFDEELVLLGEDGVPFLDPLRPKAYLVSGKSWVNNHAHAISGIEMSNPYLLHWLNSFDYSGRVTGTTRAKLNQSRVNDIPVPVPPRAEQDRIVGCVAEFFDVLDRLRELHEAISTASTELARALLHQATKPVNTARNADGPA
jgi:type I restriction enzyme M protein